MKRPEGWRLMRWRRVADAAGFGVALVEFEKPGNFEHVVFVEIKKLSVTADDGEDGEFLPSHAAEDLVKVLSRALAEGKP